MLAVVIKFLGRLLRRIFYEVGFKNLGVDAPFLGQHFDSVCEYRARVRNLAGRIVENVHFYLGQYSIDIFVGRCRAT